MTNPVKYTAMSPEPFRDVWRGSLFLRFPLTENATLADQLHAWAYGGALTNVTKTGTIVTGSWLPEHDVPHTLRSSLRSYSQGSAGYF